MMEVSKFHNENLVRLRGSKCGGGVRTLADSVCIEF